MPSHRISLVVASLLVIAGLAAPAASAQSEVTVELEGEVVSTPDELPGVYEAHLVAATSASPGPCACTQTMVELTDVATPAGVDVVLSPSAYVIDWMQHPSFDEHYKDITATISVSEYYQNQSMVTVELDGDAETNTFASDAEVLPLELALPTPDEPQEDAQADEDEEDANATASTSSTDLTTSHTTEASAAGPLSIGAFVAVASLIGLAVRGVIA